MTLLLTTSQYSDFLAPIQPVTEGSPNTVNPEILPFNTAHLLYFSEAEQQSIWAAIELGHHNISRNNTNQAEIFSSRHNGKELYQAAVEGGGWLARWQQGRGHPAPANTQSYCQQ